MNIKIIIALIALLAIGAAAWFAAGIIKERAATEQAAGGFVFVDESGESISVSFDNEAGTATMTGYGYSGLVFAQAISASGARYVNEEHDMVLWNKGDEITLYAGDQPIFTGMLRDAAEDGGESVDGESAAIEPESPSVINVQLLEHVWVWKGTELASGEIIAPNKPGVFTITFNDDETVRGATDCNGFFGPYAMQAGDRLTFGPLASTMMYCEGSQEAEFTGAIGGVTHYSLADNGDLILIGTAGSITFSRQQ